MTALAALPRARAALVVHPERRSLLARAREAATRLQEASLGELETRGDGDDEARVRHLAIETGAKVVVAAGGDGTVALVAGALLALPEDRRPDLAILALGTANNVARSYGLGSVRKHGASAVERTLRSLDGGGTRPLDVGMAGGRPFVGAFTIGMDANVLSRRNALRRRHPLGERLGGYPLYLASCVAEALVHRSVEAEIEIDDERACQPLYNLLVTTCPVYAGEFRFEGAEDPPYGRLGLQIHAHAASYLSAYVAGWRRHVGHVRGREITASPSLRPSQTVRVCLDAPAPAQADGEELAPNQEWSIDLRPGALRIRVPRPLGGPTRKRG